MAAWPIRAAKVVGLTVTVVTGHECGSVEAALHPELGPGDEFAFNALYADGMGGAIAAGVTVNFDADGWLLLLGDAPRVTPATLEKLLERGAPDAIVACRLGESFCSPVLFGSSFRSELIQLAGDSGGREILHANPNNLVLIDVDETELGDIDKPEDC
jgi:molybdenum cofactor cytidylyltransferase